MTNETCVECGIVEDSEDMELYKGKFYCSECFNKYFSYCDCCGNVVKNDEMHEIMKDDRLYVCDECFKFLTL